MNTRRDFLKKSAVAFAGVTILPSCIKKGGIAASDRLNIAIVGVGGRGEVSILALKDNPLVNLVAFADVDDARASNAFKMFTNIPRYKDFRKMLDEMDKQIDGVVVATPDHTHHYIAKCCMNMGKHVYVEKPLAHSISEVRDLMNLEKETGLACQMGNQGHSGAGNFLVQEWVKMGLLGNVYEVDAWCPYGGGDYPDTEYPKGEPIPDTLNWDLWLGPAKFRPYNSRYLPGRWRQWFDFGNGQLGDFICHNLDAAYQALDIDCPKKIEIESSEPRKLSFPESMKITFTFPSKETGKDVIVRWYNGSDYQPPRPKGLETVKGMGGIMGGTIMHGSENSIMIDSHASRPRFFPSKVQRDLIPQIKESVEKLPDSIPPTHKDKESINPEWFFLGMNEYGGTYDLATKYHYNNWLLAIKGDDTCNSNFGFSARLTETMLFANIALHLNCNLDIDPVKRTIVGNESASKMMNPTPREGWKI